MAAPVWKLKPPEIECRAFEVEALAAAPDVVAFALFVANTGWSDRALALAAEVFCAAEADEVVPAPSCAEEVPLATALPALAVVAVAADAMPASDSAAAATAAKRTCFIFWLVPEEKDEN